ncbi:MAG: ABC transporter permease [Oscillospiraceae bacterium]|nr:ABC transporter permease [Oscillospiraceae bacterium]
MLKNSLGFFRRPSTLIAAVIFLILIIVCLFGTSIAPYPPYEQNLENKLQPPGGGHLFGTDDFGRDLFSRVLAGAKYSLSAGLVSVLVGLTGGLLLGVPAGYYGGWLDRLVMLICDTMLAFPGILMAMALSMVLGQGRFTPMIAVGISSIPVFARLVRSQFLSIRERQYIEAARAAGAGDLRIALFYILPNAFGTVMVQATLRMGTAIITAATLSFLGLGAQPPEPEWGSMLNAARAYFFSAPHLAVFPGLAITITVVAVNILGDSLRDYLDPRLRER